MSGRAASKPKGKSSQEPGASETLAGDIKQLIEFMKEIRLKVNSLHETVINTDDSLVTKISTIWGDLYTEEGKVVKRIKDIETRHGQTFDRAERVYTKVLGEGALEHKFDGLSKKFYDNKTGLQNVANLVVNPVNGISALNTEVKELQKTVCEIQKGGGYNGSSDPSTSLDLAVSKRIDGMARQIQRVSEVLTRQEEQIRGLESRVLYNMAKHMSFEYSISGVRYLEKENVCLSVKSFFKNVMKFQSARQGSTKSCKSSK